MLRQTLHKFIYKNGRGLVLFFGNIAIAFIAKRSDNVGDTVSRNECILDMDK